MKRMFVAGMLALALAATAQQEASAWCRFNMSVGLNVSYESTGSAINWGCYSRIPSPPPCGYADHGFANYYQGFAGVPAHAYNNAPAPVAPAAPVHVAAPAQTQQVGYYFYSQAYAPSYWYGY